MLLLEGPLFQTVGIGRFSDEITKELITYPDLNGMEKRRGWLIVACAAGYIPIVGAISGIVLMILGIRQIVAKNDINRIIEGWTVLFRGVLSTLGVGILMAPFDIGVSIARMVRDHQNAKKLPVAHLNS
jgi:hypothetical protein